MLQDISFISHCPPSVSASAPPFTVDNVMTAVQGVNWRTLGEALLPQSFVIDDAGECFGTNLDVIERQYESSDDRLHAVVTRWVQGCREDKELSWRRLILELDREMTGVSDSIRHFAEPLPGTSCASISVFTSCTVYTV